MGRTMSLATESCQNRTDMRIEFPRPFEGSIYLEEVMYHIGATKATFMYYKGGIVCHLIRESGTDTDVLLCRLKKFCGIHQNLCVNFEKTYLRDQLLKSGQSNRWVK